MNKCGLKPVVWEGMRSAVQLDDSCSKKKNKNPNVLRKSLHLGK